MTECVPSIALAVVAVAVLIHHKAFLDACTTFHALAPHLITSMCPQCTWVGKCWRSCGRQGWNWRCHDANTVKWVVGVAEDVALCARTVAAVAMVIERIS